MSLGRSSVKGGITSASHWLLESGIQSPQGGVYVWYDLEKEKHSFLYSEITGYAVTALLFLERLYQGSLLLERAELAAAWLQSHALHSCGGVRARLYENDRDADIMYSFSAENIFSFDSGIVLYALVNLYRRTRKPGYLEIARKLGEFLLSMQETDGSLWPVFNSRQAKKIAQPDKWSNQRGAFLSKVSMGLIALSEVLEDEQYQEAASRLCRYSLTKQGHLGRFITDEQRKTTHLHAHCYCAEGLWYCGVCLKVDEFLHAARIATEWIFKHLNETGLNELYDPHTGGFNDFQRSDVLAQALRLGIIFSQEESKLTALKRLLATYQYSGSQQQQAGGFLYSKKNLHTNSWCTMFALQALELYANRQLILPSGRVELFI
jgi:uncharacterized protein YyaL (SSP411 family)